MMSSSRYWIVAAAVIAVFGTSRAEANDRNEIRAVSFSEEAGTTRVHVRGAQTPHNRA